MATALGRPVARPCWVPPRARCPRARRCLRGTLRGAASAPAALGAGDAPLVPFRPHNLAEVDGRGRRLVICPGFGNAPEDYARMMDALRRRDFDARCMELERGDWAQVFTRGLPNPTFWAGAATTAPHYSWYLERLMAAVEDAGGEDVVLVAHSAGGWLARAFVNDPAPGAAPPPRVSPGLGARALSLAERRAANAKRRRNDHANHGVSAVVTLGSPQRPPPRPSRDFTGGAVTFVNRLTASRVGEPDAPAFVCVAGRAVAGWPSATSGGEERLKQTLGARGYDAADPAAAQQPLGRAPSTPEELYWTQRASNGYAEVSGNGFGIGDAVVPVSSALLPRATNVVIDGAFHAPDGPVWYGSDEVLDAWLSSVP